MTETLNALLENVGTFFTEALSWMSEGLDTISQSPALFVLVLAMPICSFGVGLLKRILSI